MQKRKNTRFLGWGGAEIDVMAESRARPVCAAEALALLNCATEAEFDRGKCLQFLDALRKCILDKVLITILVNQNK